MSGYTGLGHGQIAIGARICLFRMAYGPVAVHILCSSKKT